MVVVVDTREHPEYRWRFPCAWVRDTLQSGDYSLRGHEAEIAIERKRPEELYGCFGQTRERFEREYQRLTSYRRAIVLVEGSIEDILRQPRHSQLSPRVVIETLNSWWVRYGIPWLPAGSREKAQALAYSILQKFHRLLLHEQAEQQRQAHDLNDSRKADTAHGR